MSSVKIAYKVSFILITVLIYGCTNPEFPAPSGDHPVLYTEDVSEIDSKGVLLKATLQLPQGEEVKTFGFMVSNQTLTTPIELSTWKEVDDFTYRLTSDIKLGDEYSFWPYATTTNFILNGAPRSFTGQGSSAIELIDFFPKTASITDEINIIGKNFSFHNSKAGLSAVSIGTGPQRPVIQELIKGDIDTIKFIVGANGLGINRSNIQLNSTNLLEIGATPPKTTEQLEILQPEVVALNLSRGFIDETDFVVTFNNFDPRQIPLTVNFITVPDSPSLVPNNALITDLSQSSLSVRHLNLGELGTKKINIDLGSNNINPGFNNAIDAGDVEILSRWERASTARVLPSFVTTVGDKSYMMSRTAFWSYAPATDQWVQLTSFPGFYSASHSFIFAVGSQIYFGSGNNPSFYRYDINTQIWSSMNNTPFTVSNRFISGVMDNEFHLFADSGSEKVHWTYNPQDDSWSVQQITSSSLRKILEPNVEIPNTIVNNELYFISGSTQSSNAALHKISVNQANAATVTDIADYPAENSNTSDTNLLGGQLVMVDGDLVSFVKRSFGASQSFKYSLESNIWEKASGHNLNRLRTLFHNNNVAFGFYIGLPADPENGGLFRYKKSLD